MVLRKKRALAARSDGLIAAIDRQNPDLARFAFPQEFARRVDALLDELDSKRNLSALGRAVVSSGLRNQVRNYKLVCQYLERHPEAESIAVEPIVIAGPFRSGTTMMHARLAERGQGAWRAPTFKELSHPVVRGPLGGIRREVLGLRDDALLRTAFPGSQAVHAIHPDAPEECLFAEARVFEARREHPAVRSALVDVDFRDVTDAERGPDFLNHLAAALGMPKDAGEPGSAAINVSRVKPSSRVYSAEAYGFAPEHFEGVPDGPSLRERG